MSRVHVFCIVFGVNFISYNALNRGRETILMKTNIIRGKLEYSSTLWFYVDTLSAPQVTQRPCWIPRRGITLVPLRAFIHVATVVEDDVRSS